MGKIIYILSVISVYLLSAQCTGISSTKLGFKGPFTTSCYDTVKTSSYLNTVTADTVTVTKLTTGSLIATGILTGTPTYTSEILKTDASGNFAAATAGSEYSLGSGQHMLKNWTSALARQKSGGTAAKCLFIGSSTTYSLYQSDPLQTNCYPARVRSMLQGALGEHAVYEGEIWLQKYQSTTPSSATTFDTRFTLGAGWVSDPNGFGPAQYAISNSADASLLTFASGENCTGFTVKYIKNNTFGSFDYRVDGGSYTTVTTGGAGSSIGTLTISGLSGTANHTVDFKFNVGSGTRVIIANIKIENSARPSGGILLTSCGINGSTTSLWSTNNGHPGSSLPLTFTATAPDLCIIQLGVNDANTNVSLSTFYTNYTAIVTYAQSVNCDVVIMIPHPFDEAGLTSSGGFTQGTWSQYKAKLLQIAAEKNCAVINMFDRWPAYSIGNASPYYYYADQIHASNKGYWDIASATFRFLMSTISIPVANVKTANYVLAGPTTGSDAAPSYRALVSADLPTTVTPTAIKQPVSSTGYELYNTSDQTTNFEKFSIKWTSNVATMLTNNGGTGTLRDFEIGLNTTAIRSFLITSVASPAGQYRFRGTTAGTGNTGLGVSMTFTGSSSSQRPFGVVPTINQSSTAGYQALWISPYEQATGSGSKYLIDGGTNSAADGGGTHTSKFSVDNAGSTKISGSLTIPYVEKTTTYSVAATDHTINCTSGTFTVTLPTAVGITGRVYVIKNSGAGTITVATTSSQTIDGSTTAVISTQYSSINVQSTGSNWIIW